MDVKNEIFYFQYHNFKEMGAETDHCPSPRADPTLQSASKQKIAAQYGFQSSSQLSRIAQTRGGQLQIKKTLNSSRQRSQLQENLRSHTLAKKPQQNKRKKAWIWIIYIIFRLFKSKIG